MKYLSLFSGIGGFELGIQQAHEDNNSRENKSEKTQRHGHSSSKRDNELPKQHDIQTPPTCIGYSEIDKYAIKVYNKHFKHKEYGDITKIEPNKLPDFELLVGGFPCQSFSIAGNRGGFNDTRGTLFFEIVRIIKEKQPRLLLLENVKGLLSHDKGSTFNTIISTIDELGYDCQWQVLNSKNFGVPQNRERVFIVGHLRGTPRPKVFPIGESDKVSDKTVNGQEYIIRGRPNMPYKSGERKLNFKKYSDCCPTLSENCASGDQKNIVMPSVRKLTPKECERLQGFPDDWTKFGIMDIPKHKKPCAKKQVTAVVVNNGKIFTGTNECDNPQKECPRKSGEDYLKCKVICKQKDHAEMIAIKKAKGGKLYLHGHNHFCNNCLKEMKRYGIKEFEIGLPLIEISDTQRYKMCGNAVTVNVIKEIVKRLI